MGDSLSWTLDRDRNRVPALEVSARTAEIESGLAENPGSRLVDSDAPAELVREVLATIHDSDYLEFLERASEQATAEHPVLDSAWSAPGVAADTPVCVGSAAAARSAVATALTAARRLEHGERFTYAVCRPPGHHVGPRWMGGYCYLNNAAAVVSHLRRNADARVGILDIDFHLGNGTAAIVSDMEGVWLESIHGSTVENFPWQRAAPLGPRQRFHEFAHPPSVSDYLDRLDQALARLASHCDALVVSLGYDIVWGDPHGHWSLPPIIFTEIGLRLAATGLPICAVQEGGYSKRQLGRCASSFAGGLNARSRSKVSAS